MNERRPNIVVVDGLTTTRGDLDFTALAAFGELTVYERCGTALCERCREADIVLTNKEVFDAATLAQLPRLRFISVLATGTNVVDLPAASRAGIVVSNVPSYSTDSVAQHVFSLLLELNNRTADNAAFTRSGGWSHSGQFSAPQHPITELSGKVFGIVGLGEIGRRVAQVADAFGMRVLAARSLRKDSDVSDASGVRRVPLSQLLAEADVVSLHCPLTEQTRGLIGAAELAQMKTTAILLNTGRGPLVDEQALADALARGAVRGAGLDVLSEEPPPPDHPLLSAPNCLVTPHVAWASVEARQRLLEVSVRNVERFVQGRPQNVVAPG